MIELFTSLILPVTFLYILPFGFGLWFINKEITARRLNTRTAWMVCLFLTPLLTIAIFYFVEIRIRKIQPKF
jgi:hypothetical protein